METMLWYISIFAYLKAKQSENEFNITVTLESIETIKRFTIKAFDINR